MKKGKLILISFLTVVAALVVLAGCGKSATDNKLVGRWQRINVENLSDTTYIQDWEFLGGNTMRIYFTRVTDPNPEYVEGTYTLKSAKIITVSGSASEGFPIDLNGNWRIVKLKKDVLIVVMDEGGHGLTFKEFKKV